MARGKSTTQPIPAAPGIGVEIASRCALAGSNRIPRSRAAGPVPSELLRSGEVANWSAVPVAEVGDCTAAPSGKPVSSKPLARRTLRVADGAAIPRQRAAPACFEGTPGVGLVRALQAPPRPNYLSPANQYESTKTPFKMHSRSRPPQAPAAALSKATRRSTIAHARSPSRRVTSDRVLGN